MNWMLIAVILILAACMVWGYFKGILRVIYSMVVGILMLLFVSWATPFVANILTDQTQVDEKLEEKYTDSIQKMVEKKLEEQKENLTTTVEGNNSVQIQTLEELGIILPSFLTKQINDSAQQAQTTLEGIGLYQSIGHTLAEYSVKAIAFIIVLVITLILYFVIAKLLDIVNKIPIIGGINQFLGLIAGIVLGIAIIWIGFAIIAFCSGSTLGAICIEQISDSAILSWVYEHNLILGFILLFL